MVALVLVVGWSSRGFWRDTAARFMAPSIPAPIPFIAQKPTAPTSTSPASTAPTKAEPATPSPVIDPGLANGTKLPEPARLPTQINLAIPFLSQAPKQNWEMPYQEACEEASMIMVDAYLNGQTQAFTPEAGDRAILDLVSFETKHGLGADITAAEAGKVITSYFTKRKVRVIQNPTVTQVRDYLAQSIPVIVPADGKALKNPNFRNGGPPYHMLVIKGYLPDGRWITNDPGTRKGADYIYDREVLWSAISDWNGGDVRHGTPTIIVMEPNP